MKTLTHFVLPVGLSTIIFITGSCNQKDRPLNQIDIPQVVEEETTKEFVVEETPVEEEKVELPDSFEVNLDNHCDEILPFIAKIQDILVKEEEYDTLDYQVINTYVTDLIDDRKLYDSLLYEDGCTGEEVRKKCYDYRMEIGSFYNIYAARYVYSKYLPPFMGISEYHKKEDVLQKLGRPYATCKQVFYYISTVEEDESYMGFRWNVYIIFKGDKVRAFLFSPNFHDC